MTLLRNESHSIRKDTIFILKSVLLSVFLLLTSGCCYNFSMGLVKMFASLWSAMFDNADKPFC